MLRMVDISRPRTMEQHGCAHQDPHHKNCLSPDSSDESMHQLNRMSSLLAEGEGMGEQQAECA
jgi:hypothetical protein